MSGVLNIFLAQSGASSGSFVTFTVTIANYSGSTMGYTLYGSSGSPLTPGAGSVVPSPALLQTDQDPVEQTELQEITNYATGIEIFWGSGFDAGADATSLITFNTFSTIEIDHAGGTEIVNMIDTGSGGDLDQGSSTVSAGYSDFWFPNVPKIWEVGHVGQSYDIRMYYS